LGGGVKWQIRSIHHFDFVKKKNYITQDTLYFEEKEEELWELHIPQTLNQVQEFSDTGIVPV
jgi:hypothetical protein